MIVLDANLLVYAYTESAKSHARARRWLERTLSGSDPVRIPWTSIHAFLRIVTHPSLYEAPLSMERAASAVEQWLEQPHVDVLLPGARYRSILRELFSQGQVRGNLVMDAHLAALTIEHAGTLYTTDRDFSRFDELRIVNPIA